MSKLAGKIALITGGNSGIGLETARTFAREGARVVVTARSEASAHSAREAGIEVIATDVTRVDEITRLFDEVQSRHGHLDVVMANAGVATPFGPTTEIAEADFDDTFATNVKGVFFTVAKALPLLAPGSSVILTASVAAIKGVPGHAVYSASKAAVRSLARGWTAEVKPSQTRFNVISPGPVETPIYNKLGMTPEQSQQLGAQLLQALPVGRLGKPAEVAALALFLASDDSGFCCGGEFFVDGGFGQI